MSKIFKVVVAWIIGLFLISFIGSLTLPKISNAGLGSQSSGRNYSFYLSLAQWDGGNYLEIAQNGYLRNSYYAFSPLYPGLIGFLSKMTKLDLVISGIFISVVSFLAFVYFFHKYVSLLFGEKQAGASTLTFVFFPTTFFCLLIYSESLFLLFMILSMYAFAKKDYPISIVTAAVAPLIRHLGVFLILGHLFKVAIEDKNLKLSLAFVISSVPFATYTMVLYIVFNNPLFFASTQSLWSRFALDPVSTIFLYLVPVFSLQPLSLNNLFDLFVTATFLLVLVSGIRHLPKNLWIVSVLAILIPASTGTLTGMPRYALISLGAFILLGKFISDKPKLKALVWSTSLALQCVLFALFITGHWIA